MADDSVHALLADEELVDCTLLIDGEGMGHLLGDDKAGDLAKGAQLKLALWLALVLAKKNMVRISLPNRYGPSVRADLEAGPTVVDLHSIAPYYYTVGHKLADATGEDSLRKELRAAISGDRFEKAFDWSQVSLDRDVSELRETLAREEQELFDAGYRAARDVRAWKRRRTARLTTAAIYKRAAPERVGEWPAAQRGNASTLVSFYFSGSAMASRREGNSSRARSVSRAHPRFCSMFTTTG